MKDDNELAIQIKPKDFELIQEFNDDPEKRLRLYDLIFRCSFLGEELNEEDMGVKMAAKAILGGIEECRNNYKEKCKKNAEYGIQGKEYGIQGKEYGVQGKEFGIQGKEYGIQGGEFGKLGGRPRKGETKEQYAERKKKENAEWEKQQELYKMITAEQGLFDFIKVVSQNQLQELASAYISKGFTKPQVSKVFEYIRGKKCG